MRVAVTLTEHVTYRIRPEAQRLVISLDVRASRLANAERGPGSAPRRARRPSLRMSGARVRGRAFRPHSSRRHRHDRSVERAGLHRRPMARAGNHVSSSRAPRLPKELERILDLSATSTRVRAVSTFKIGRQGHSRSRSRYRLLPRSSLRETRSVDLCSRRRRAFQRDGSWPRWRRRAQDAHRGP